MTQPANNDASPTTRDWHQVAQEITTERDPQKIMALVQELGRLLGKTPARNLQNIDPQNIDPQNIDLQSNP